MNLLRARYLRISFLILWLWTGLAAGWAQNATTPAAGATNPSAAVETAKNGASEVWLTFGLDRVPFLSRTIAHIPLWQFLASLIYIFLAFYLSKILDLFIRERVQKWAEKTDTKLDDLLVNLVRGPVKVVSFVILLHIGMRVYSWPEGFATFLSSGLKIIVACSITYVLLKAVDMLMGVWSERATTHDNHEFSRH